MLKRVIFTAFIFFCALLQSNAGQSPPYSIKIANPKDIHPGGFVAVIINNSSNDPLQNYSYVFNNYNAKFFFYKNNWHAIIPISFYALPGKYQLVVNDNNQQLTSLEFIIKQKKRSVYHLGRPSPLPNSIIQRIEKEKKYLQKIYEDTEHPAYFKGFTLPLKSTIVTSEYGVKRVRPNRYYYHAGTDFKAKPGEKNYSTAEGIVAYTGRHFLEGNIVIINHGSGIYSCYIHLSKIKTKPGKKVKKGELIAYSGQTGAAARGPHLHFMIKIYNTPVDPIAFIKYINNL